MRERLRSIAGEDLRISQRVTGTGLAFRITQLGAPPRLGKVHNT
jgi:hypothetical protein